jgi:hypothetical protein
MDAPLEEPKGNAVESPAPKAVEPHPRSLERIAALAVLGIYCVINLLYRDLNNLVLTLVFGGINVAGIWFAKNIAEAYFWRRTGFSVAASEIIVRIIAWLLLVVPLLLWLLQNWRFWLRTLTALV